MSARGGARAGAGRPKRVCAQAAPDDVPKARPGPYMTDAEWAPVAALAVQDSIPVTDAMRRLIAAGAGAGAGAGATPPLVLPEPLPGLAWLRIAGRGVVYHMYATTPVHAQRWCALSWRCNRVDLIADVCMGARICPDCEKIVRTHKEASNAIE